MYRGRDGGDRVLLWACACVKHAALTQYIVRAHSVL